MKKFIVSLLIWETIGLFIFSFFIPVKYSEKATYNINITNTYGITQNICLSLPKTFDYVIKEYNNNYKLIIKSYGYTIWGYESGIYNIEAEIPSVKNVNFVNKLK